MQRQSCPQGGADGVVILSIGIVWRKPLPALISPIVPADYLSGCILSAEVPMEPEPKNPIHSDCVKLRKQSSR